MRPSIRLHDPDFYRGDPFPAYQWLRRESPVHWYEERGWWALSRYRDVRWVSTQPHVFSSAQGFMLPEPGEIGPDRLDLLLFADPPRHRRLRKVLKDTFAPRRIRSLEPRIREIAVGVLEGVEEDGVVDFAEHVAAPLPTIVVAELIGIPAEDWNQFRVWSDTILASQDPDIPGDSEEALRAMDDYFLRVIDDRRRRPRGDLVSHLLAVETEQGRLTQDEVFGFCWLLLLAGNETTRNLIGQGTLALLQHPGQLRKLVDDPALVPSAIEEMLRWCSPTTHMVRTATREIELRDREILPGQKVVMLYSSANRDEEVFGDGAEEFEVTRHPNPHLSFGFGEHICMGAGLARLEARVMFEELLPRLARAELAGETRRIRSAMTPGIVSLPVRLGAA